MKKLVLILLAVLTGIQASPEIAEARKSELGSRLWHYSPTLFFRHQGWSGFVYAPVKNIVPVFCGNGRGMGLLLDAYTVLTATHVTECGKLPSIWTSKQHTAYAVKEKANRDMSVLEFPEPVTNEVDHVSFASIAMGEKVYSVFYEKPLEITSAHTSVRFKNGSVVENIISVNYHAVYGESGSPAFNDRGSVVGLFIGAGEDNATAWISILDSRP